MLYIDCSQGHYLAAISGCRCGRNLATKYICSAAKTAANNMATIRRVLTFECQYEWIWFSDTCFHPLICSGVALAQHSWTTPSWSASWLRPPHYARSAPSLQSHVSYANCRSNQTGWCAWHRSIKSFRVQITCLGSFCDISYNGHPRRNTTWHWQKNTQLFTEHVVAKLNTQSMRK